MELVLFSSPVGAEWDDSRIQIAMAERNVREVSTNALPCLLAWINYEPSSMKLRFQSWMRSLAGTWIGARVPRTLYTDQAAKRAALACVGFEVLGPKANAAIPRLKKLAQQTVRPRSADRAAWALSRIGPDGLSASFSLLSDSNCPSRPAIAMALAHLSQSLDFDKTNLAPAIPLLTQCATSSDPDLTNAAAYALRAISPGHGAIATVAPIYGAVQPGMTKRMKRIRSETSWIP
ncbi:MAG TPA: hypothetical protein VEC99_13615 [Clostridia bacterium]|nr:hypothetical protein [Clostridia bacterium]